ncbi:MAG: HEAT repeat domain-containing protein [Spirochaetes bacterium]|nr:HEAT repeat domain-containing protein [Spirochaetota bacterium]
MRKPKTPWHGAAVPCRRSFYCALMLLVPLLVHCGHGMYITDEAAIAALIKDRILQYQNSDWETRQHAVSDLAAQGERSDNKLLEIALIVSSEDQHPGVRIEALKGLAAMKTEKTLERLSDIALSDDSPNVRWQALKALAPLRNPSVIDVFTRCYDSDDWLIREASIEGLMTLGDQAPRDTILTYAEKGLKDPNESVKITTMKCLTVKDDALYPMIKEIFNREKKSSHPLLNASLIALKGYVLDAQTREDVIDLLAHRNLEIRLQALRVLKEDWAMKARTRK